MAAVATTTGSLRSVPLTALWRLRRVRRHLRLYPEALADFLVDRHALAGFNRDGHPVPDRLVECAALLSTEHAAMHVAVIDERHRVVAVVPDVEQ